VRANPLTIELLTWVSVRPRAYEEAIDAWRTSCPRLSIWDDALIDGLVRVVRTGEGDVPHVALTELGRAALETAVSSPAA
jgi:hypothetical protein